jgi:hypothetical protein
MLGPTTKIDFDSTLREVGHPVYLRRRRDAAGTGPYMRVEGGRYIDQLEMWTSYRVMRRTMRAGALGFTEPEGYIGDNSTVFYFQSECMPKTHDLVMENSPHERHARETYIITRSVPYYIGGTVVYYACLCERVKPVV